MDLLLANKLRTVIRKQIDPDDDHPESDVANLKDLEDDLDNDLTGDDDDAFGTEFKSTFVEIGVLDFHQLFQLISKLFAHSCCPTILAACLQILVELLHRTCIPLEQLLSYVGSETFMSKLHLILICSTNPQLQGRIGDFLLFFSFAFSLEFSAFVPLVQHSMQMREEKFASSLMGSLVEAVLYIEVWPMGTDFYEFLNLLSTKLAEYGEDGLEEPRKKFHERLSR